MGYVYKITNNINNKVYIGITTKDIETRWKEHIQMAHDLNHDDSKALFKKAIRKYGEENFSIEIIDEIEDIEQLKQMEIYWIDYYNAFAFDENSNGYNSTRGGDGVFGFNDVAISQFDIVTGKKIADYKSVKQAEQAINSRIEAIGQFNRSAGGYCFFYTNEIKNLTENELIEKVHNLYPNLVYQLDQEGKILNLYRNTTEAFNAVGGSQGNIIGACNGVRRLAKGYQWCYQKDLKNRINKSPRDIKDRSIEIIQYKMNGEKIKIWPSIREAAKSLDLGESHISQCCKGKRQSCGQFQWRYAEDEIEKLPPLKTKRKVQCIETGEIFNTVNHAAKHFKYAHQTVKNSCEGKIIQKDYHFQWYDG